MQNQNKTEEVKEVNDSKININSTKSDNSSNNKKIKIIVIVVVSIIIIVAIVLLCVFLIKKDDDKDDKNTKTNSDDSNSYEVTIDRNKVSYKTKNLIDKDTIIEEGNYNSTSSDETVFLVVNGALLSLGRGVIITKTGENTKNLKINRSTNLSSKYELKKRLLDNENGGGELPEKPEGEGGEPPEKPEGEGGENMPPEKPEGDGGEPPEKPEGEGGENMPQGGGEGGDDNYSFYGTNSAIVVLGEGSKAIIDGVSITTDSYGANAVVAVNGGEVTITDSTINTSNDSSRGLHATYKGKITAENVKITTKGGSCANLATDRGEGTINAKSMTLSTAGAGSPLVYSTGDITVSSSEGSATGAQICVVEGKNSAKFDKCDFSCTGKGNRGNVDIAGVMVYQSMSGDANVGLGNFEATNSNFTITESDIQSQVPMFFVTNTQTTINITNVKMKFESGLLMKVQGTDEWGTSGKNGGQVTFTTKNEELIGKISADNISYVQLNYDEKTSPIDNSKLSLEGNITISKLIDN